MLTYGDGVANIVYKRIVLHSISRTIKLPIKSPVQPEAGLEARWKLKMDNIVDHFKEKPKGDNKWINGGFFVLKPEVFSYLNDTNIDEVMWEDAPMQNLANDKQLVAYKHTGFWKPMDALRDKLELENLWQSGNAKWKTW